MQNIIYKRDITITLVARLAGKGLLIQVITGPRQVGKTTAIRQVLAELALPYFYATSDLPAAPDVSWIGQQWEQARMMFNERGPVILVLDEVQKVDRWSEEVKRLWDEDRMDGKDIRVVILGSSSLLIQEGLTESLAGRFELLRCLHWEFQECKRCFGWDLDRYIYFGGYPAAATLIQDEERWGAYVRDSLIETAISKDVLLLNLVEKPALLRKLFVLACEYGAQILSYQKILGQLSGAGNTTTLAHYQRLLESAYLIAGLEKFSGSRVMQRSSSPKWLPLNTGLATALAQSRFDTTRKDLSTWGRLVECAIGAHLFNQALRSGLQVFYWREGNLEVDYVLKKGKQVIALEVKSGAKKKSLSGLLKFQEKFKPVRSLVVGSTGIPVEEFLSMDILSLFP